MNPYDNNAYDYPNGQEPEVVEANRVTSPDQKKNVAVAAGGTTLLAASAIGLGMLDDSDTISDDELSDASAYNSNNASTVEPPLIVPIANTGNNGITSMNDLDDLDTFDKAFAAARHLVGPGHHFTWHGNNYNTYYSEELDALSPAERQAFIATLDGQAEASQPREVTPVPAQHHAAPRHTEAMLAQQEVEPVSEENNVPEIVPLAAATTGATYLEVTPLAHNDVPEITPADEPNGMGPHIVSQDEYMGHQAVGHDDVVSHYDTAHDQISSHDLGLHMAE